MYKLNFYILTLPQLFTTFQTVVSGDHIHYTLTSPTLDTRLLEDLEENDIIFMYYAKPKDVIPMKFTVSNVEDDGLTLKKEIERHPGASQPFLNEPSLEEAAQTDSYMAQIDSSLGNKINEELYQCDDLEEREQEVDTDDTLIYDNAKILAEKVRSFKDQETDLQHNLIYFGAPGTGKSYLLNKEINNNFSEQNYERVTFFNRYTYSNFIGSYKPVEENNEITYKFTSGPFIRTLIKAYKMIMDANEQKEVPKIALVIEEINRADAASVFGDMFQLLDRENGISEYVVNVSKELQEELCTELIPNFNQIKDVNVKNECLDLWRTIHLPANLFLWATMNSADQGVYPMDTAFKRRWDFNYLNIDNNEHLIENTIVIFKTSQGNDESFDWNELRQKINNRLFTECNVDEDKLLGPFFLSYNLIKNVQKDPDKYSESFIRVLKDKVFMYLYEDAARHYRQKVFAGCQENSSFSHICNQFDEIGLDIFQFKKDLN